jgi:hypothetical protein
VLLAGTRVYYANARLGIDQRLDRVFALEFSAGDIAADWDLADEIKLDLRELESRPDATARFQPLPAGLANEKSLDAMERGFKRWLRADQPLIILKSASLKLNSEPGETEAEFRIRLQHAANEARDIQLAKLRARYETKVDRLEARLLRARQALERESEQARGAQLDTALSIGTAVLGALLGRKRVSVTNASRAGSAARKASGARRQAGDVKRAKEAIAALEEKLQELSAAFDGDVEGLEASFDAQDDDLSEVPVRPRSTDIEIKFFGVGWLPAAMT